MLQLPGPTLEADNHNPAESDQQTPVSSKKPYMPIKKLKPKPKMLVKDLSPANRTFTVTRQSKLRSRMHDSQSQFEIPRDQIEDAHSQIEDLLKEKIVIDPAEAERREFRERIGTQIIEAARDRCRTFQLESNHKKHFLLDRKFTDTLNKAARADLLESFKTVPADPDQATQPRVLLTNPDFKRYFDLDKRMFGQLDSALVDALNHTRMKEKGEVAAEGKKFLSYYEGLLMLGEDQMQKLSLMRKTQSVSQQQRVRRMQANREFFHSMSQEIQRAEKIREIRQQHQNIPHRKTQTVIPTELSASGSQVDLVEYAKSGGQRRGLSIVERFMRRTIQQTEKVTFHLGEIAHQHQLEKRKHLEKLRSSSIMERSMSNLLQKPKIRIVAAEDSMNKSTSKMGIHFRTTHSFMMSTNTNNVTRRETTNKGRKSQTFDASNNGKNDLAQDASQLIYDKAELLNQELEAASVTLSKTAISLLDAGNHFDKKQPSRLESPTHPNRLATGESSVSSKATSQGNLQLSPSAARSGHKPGILIKKASSHSVKPETDPPSRQLSRGNSLVALEKHIEDEKTRLLARANKFMLARGGSRASSRSKTRPALETMDLDQQTKHLLFLQDRGQYADDHHLLDAREMAILEKLTKHHKRAHRLAAYRDSHQTIYLNEGT